MDYRQMSCGDFIEAVAGSAPTPGGGGASAYVGAVGMALGNMVGSLTRGKPKYQAVEADIIALQQQADALQQQLLDLVAKDAEVFMPLSRAYALPKDTEEQCRYKAIIMEAALVEACSVPLEIMEKCAAAILLHQQFAAKGSAIAISDVGVGVAVCEAALKGASLNVFINTKSMTDREEASRLTAQAQSLLAQYCPLAQKIFMDVWARFL
ncbi:MAG: cyclodeaminase/cyclohydrolase family protein [Clostridiales bacterium]